MSKNISRRSVVNGGLTMAALSSLPMPRMAFAASDEEGIIAAAKSAGGTDLKGMIWSNYYVAMKPTVPAFKQATGYGVGSIQDISVFSIPQRAMAEAITRSPEFDFFHLDSNMIPSLASAGLLEPLDKYMDKAGFKLNAVGNFGNFMKYKGNTYGIVTDGNVHVHMCRKDMMENPEEQKGFEDKHGKKMAYPETWEDDQRLMEWFHRPDKGIWSSGNLRNRPNGVTWWYMYFYSAGGFPFDDDMNPTLNTPAGNYAVETYLNMKKVSHPEAPGWGTPQMIPRIASGKIYSCQYWDGAIGLNENPKKSKTAGKYTYGLIPGSDFSGKRMHRSISSPVAAILVNRYSKNKERAAYMAMWWATQKNSETIVGDNVNTFHDPWHVAHFKSDKVYQTYKAGLPAINSCLQVASPPIYLTGLLEFQDQLAKNLSEAYVGQRKAKDVLPETEKAWKKIVRKIGKKKLKAELASYKALFPKVNVPG